LSYSTKICLISVIQTNRNTTTKTSDKIYITRTRLTWGWCSTPTASKATGAEILWGTQARVNKEYTFAKGNNHINGVESLWASIKERMNKFHGVKMSNYYPYLKEMEFRFKNQKTNLFKKLSKIIYKEFGTETT